jgi:hypothetical protein
MSVEDDIRSVHEVQGRHGNWNYSPYMRGMFNGLELGLALIEGRPPRYRGEPEKYLCDLPLPVGVAAPEGEETPV